MYDRLGGLPTGRASRLMFAWYGGMDIASHFRRLAQNSGLRVTVLLHAPLDPAAYRDRKTLAPGIRVDGPSTWHYPRFRIFWA